MSSCQDADPMDIDDPQPISSDSSTPGVPSCFSPHFSNTTSGPQSQAPIPQNPASPALPTSLSSSSPRPATAEAISLPHYAHFPNPYLSRPSGYQFTQPVSQFLSAYPPSTPTPSSIGNSPWLFVSNPHVGSTLTRRPNQDLAGFVAAGEVLLSEYGAEIAKIERLPVQQKRRGTDMGKRLEELRAGLRVGIMKEARERVYMSGKWMLFPSVGEVDDVWAKVATATVEGGLGIAAKVAVDSSGTGGGAAAEGRQGNGKGRLICVYTYDAEDRGDVKKVLNGLKGLGVLPAEETRSGGIYYKCDAFTHLGITNGNQWGVRASLYGSRDRDMKA